MTQKVLNFTDLMKLDSQKEEEKKTQKESELKMITPDQDPKKLDPALEEISTLENSSTVPWKISTLEEISTLENSSSLEPEIKTVRLENSSSLKGFLKLPNWVLDELPKHLGNNEQLLYIHLFRLSHGYGNDHCTISLEKLAMRVGMTHRTVQKTLITLQNKGMIKKVGYHFGNVKVKGTDIWVANFSKVENSATLEKSSNIKSYSKEKLKETYTKLVRQFREIYPEKKIGEIAEEVKIACNSKKIPFDYKVFNDLDNKIWI